MKKALIIQTPKEHLTLPARAELSAELSEIKALRPNGCFL
jgi:hypothetical protein